MKNLMTTLAGLVLLSGCCMLRDTRVAEGDKVSTGMRAHMTNQEVVAPAEVVAKQQPATRASAPKPFDAREVYFETNSTALNQDAKGTLREVAAWMKTNPGVKLRIEGFADKTGTTQYNLGLSNRRAEALKNALTLEGVERTRLFTVKNTTDFGDERKAIVQLEKY